MKGHPYWENDKLGAESEFYHDKAPVYEIFSQAEDSSHVVADFYKEIIKDKIILDVGCGTGKFIPSFAPLAKEYIWVDASEYQLNIAHKKAEDFSNVKLLHTSAHEIPIESQSIEVVIGNWFIWSVHDLSLRNDIITELKRVVKYDGMIYFTENDITGEFKQIIEDSYGKEKTEIKFKWLEDAGFEKIASLNTYFSFRNVFQAQDVFKEIWWEEIAMNITKEIISHDIVIYRLKST